MLQRCSFVQRIFSLICWFCFAQGSLRVAVLTDSFVLSSIFSQYGRLQKVQGDVPVRRQESRRVVTQSWRHRSGENQ